MGAPRHAAQLATWQPVPTVGAGVGLPLLLRLLPPLSVDAPLATQLEPLAVCTSVKPCDRRNTAAVTLWMHLECGQLSASPRHKLTMILRNIAGKTCCACPDADDRQLETQARFVVRRPDTSAQLPRQTTRAGYFVKSGRCEVLTDPAWYHYDSAIRSEATMEAL